MEEGWAYLKRIVSVLIIVLVVIAIGYFSVNFFISANNDYTARQCLETKMHIQLSENSKIENFEEDSYDGFLMKISIDEQDTIKIKKQLNAYFEGPFEMGKIHIPNFENVCTWWDLDKGDIEQFYFKLTDGSNKPNCPKSRDVWAFLTKDESGHHYLYFSY